METSVPVPSPEQRTHEIERGYILRYLAVAGFKPVTPKTLLYHLRDVRYPCTAATLAFHLKYMQEKSWVDLEYKEVEVGETPEILSVKITAAGVDLLDRRRAGQPGVSF